MAGACPAADPDDPLVRSLLGVVDCNVRQLVHSGYASLFQSHGPLSAALTALLTLYVALIGYRLMLGRTQLSVSDVVLNAVKLGAVLALATQWDLYQTVVYGFLFAGPQQLAAGMMTAFHTDAPVLQGDVFDSLQSAFDALSSAGSSFASHAPPSTNPMMGGPGFAAILLTASASILLMSSLGVLLAAKIVLGFLLAVGPIFIALLLFDSTRGLFEGWLRASLAFAFAPLATTLLLGVALMMLEPSLARMQALQGQGIYTLAPVYSAMTLVLVFAGVSLGALVAAAMIASGLRMPSLRRAPAGRPVATDAPAGVTIVDQPRAARVAAAALALDRRETRLEASPQSVTSSDRRTVLAERTAERGARDAADPIRLGLQRRASARPRTGRAASASGTVP